MLQSRFDYDTSRQFRRSLVLSGSILLMAGISSGALAQTKMVQLPIPVPPVVTRSVRTSVASPTQSLNLVISLPPTSLAAMTALADSVSDPKSPSYRHFLTPAQVGAQFGQPTTKVQQVVTYLQQQGMKVTFVSQSHMSIFATCTVQQANAAFATSIINYKTIRPNEPGRSVYYSYDEPISVPATIAPIITSINGLENFTKAHPRQLTPNLTRALYDTAPIYNAGMTGQNRNCAISSFDGFRLSNVPLYYTEYNLPAPAGGVGSNITVIPLDGGSGGGTPGGEGDLDIQMVLGMAPQCTFEIYDGGAGLTDVLAKEADDNFADVISESYGWNLDDPTAQACHATHVQMSLQGITYMNASGDDGTSTLSGPFTYPDYDTETLEVGGTIASYNSSGVRTNEVAWSGSGGGWVVNSSTINFRPAWQVGNGIPTDINFRLVPDVSLQAAGADGGAYFFYYNGTLTTDFDGTSFASPVFTGCLAVTEQKVISIGGLPPDANGKQRFGRIANLIYSQNGRSDVWYDVVSGDTGPLPNGQDARATPGWDFTTGWGCIDFAAFAASSAVSPPVVYAPTSATVFDDTYSNPNIVEGKYVSGNAASLAAVDGNNFVVSPVQEGSLGEVASVVAGFSTNLTPTTAASINIGFQGAIPAQATVMIYGYNWTTKTYGLIKSISGTQAGSSNSISISSIGTYLSSSGQLQILARSLVPTDRLAGVGSYKFSVDQLVILGVKQL